MGAGFSRLFILTSNRPTPDRQPLHSPLATVFDRSPPGSLPHSSSAPFVSKPRRSETGARTNPRNRADLRMQILAVLVLAAQTAAAPAHSTELRGEELMNALQSGGYTMPSRPGPPGEGSGLGAASPASSVAARCVPLPGEVHQSRPNALWTFVPAQMIRPAPAWATRADGEGPRHF